MSMRHGHASPQRRRLVLGAAALGLTSSPLPLLAQGVLLTPRQTEGPFYPPKLPADQDNDLISVKGASARAMGEITHLSGRILDARGRSLRSVRVEIWQCDANGRYLHPGDSAGVDRDPNFQGFGHYLTAEDGSYSFRTIRPVPYPGRTPHIHFKLRSREFPEFVTQMYISGHPQNASDMLLGSVRDPKARASLMANFQSIKGEGGAMEWTAQFDLVLGVTPRQA